MANLPDESVRRIADARRDAESELKKAISAVAETEAVAAYLPAITSFASALFDAEAGELLAVFEDAEGFETALENKVAPRIIEGVLPDRSLNRVRERGTEEVMRLSVEYEVKTELLFEVGADGTSELAGAYTRGLSAPHGAWENFMPMSVRFRVRVPNNNATIRAILSQALQQRTDYWAGQFQVRATAGPSYDRALIQTNNAIDRGLGGEEAMHPLGNGETNLAIKSNAGGQGLKRGPQPDFESAARVAEIVARMAPNGDWRARLDDICDALDKDQIPFPTRWRKRDRSCDGWVDYDERANAVKAIEYRLEAAKQRKKTTPGIFS
jgi:hypothetical protein